MAGLLLESKRTVRRRTIEAVVDFDSHDDDVPEGEPEDEERKSHVCCDYCLRKTVERAGHPAVAVDAAIAVHVAAHPAEMIMLAAAAAAAVGVRKEARIAIAAVPLPPHRPEIC